MGEHDRPAVKLEVHGPTGQQSSCPIDHAARLRSDAAPAVLDARHPVRHVSIRGQPAEALEEKHLTIGVSGGRRRRERIPLEFRALADSDEDPPHPDGFMNRSG
jgi:hypothetical protein